MTTQDKNVANVLGYTESCIEAGILDPVREIAALRSENQQLRVKIATLEQSLLAAARDVLCRSVESLDLSVRTKNCLTNVGIVRIGELVQWTEQNLLKSRNFGRRSIKEIREILADMGLDLGMKLEPGWNDPRRDLGP